MTGPSLGTRDASPEALAEASGAASGRSRPSRRLVALVLVLACTPFAIGLGEPPLWDANEPLYAEPPREALEIGTVEAFLAPPWNYRPWWVRPPLSSWLTIPSYALFGATPFAERLPMALAAMATILAAYALGRTLGDRLSGLLAAAVLAATPRFWTFAREYAGDAYLTAILTGAFALAAPALRGGPGAPRRMLAAHALVGIGCLAKGPAILALWAVPLLVARYGARPRVPWRVLRPGALAASAIALGAPWFAYMAARYGPEYVRVFFGHHNLRRVLSDEVGTRPWHYYFEVLAAQAQPWLLVLPFAVRRWWRGARADPAAWLVGAGALSPIVLFSLASGKRDVYLMPIYPLLAASLAPFLAEIWAGAWRRATGAYATTLTLAGTALAGVVLAMQAHVPYDLGLALVAVTLLMVPGGILLVVATHRRSGRGVLGVTIATILVLEAGAAVAMPVLARYRPVPTLCEALSPRLGPADDVVVYRAALHSPMFYLRRRTTVAHGPEDLRATVRANGAHRAWVIAPAKEVAALDADFAVSEIARAPYLRLNFRTAVLGKGRSTEDLVLAQVLDRDALILPILR